MSKLNYLFRSIAKITTVLTIFSLLIVSSCKDDEQSIAVATIEFATDAQTVSESGTGITVTINFDKEAGKDGTITIDLGGTATYTDDYMTNPNGSSSTFDINVTEGQTVAQFTVTPVNNALLGEANKKVELTIVEVTNAFEIGENALNTITITDDEGPTTADFALSSSSTAENLTDGIDVTINLSASAPGTGNVTVSFTSSTATYTTNFTTEPAATAGQLIVPVAQSATSVTFKVKPVDDGNINASREISFSIASADGVVEVGNSITAHTVTITDNETPSTATFTLASGSIGEAESAGKTVEITLDPQTNGSGTIAVTITGGVYDTDYTTEPVAVGGVVTVNVASSATLANFKVIPKDNSTDDGDKTLTLTMTGSTGIVVLGSNNITYDLTLEEDDAISTIADVRAMYPATTTISSSLRIQGIVTSTNPEVNQHNIWVQDATGGIVIRFPDTPPNSTPNNGSFVRGDEVIVQLNGGVFIEFNGLLQAEDVVKTNVTVVDQGNPLPTPEVITVAQLNSGAYEGKLVRVNDVAFVDADGTATMSGTRTISNGTTTTNVRTETGASHAGSTMPLGFGTITGLAGENIGAAQIIPIVFADDVFASSAVGTIGVTQTLTDFGSVDNATESTSQSYTVQGITLNSDVVVTASTGFKVSADDITFTSSITIPAASANSSNPVFVKFAPTTGVNQAVNGTITHKSLGAAPQSFNVSGTESGNAVGTGTLVIYEVYGGGGNSGATYTNDYVVLYNGTSNAIDLTGYSLQYASSTGIFGTTNNSNLSGTIQPGDYFLIQLAAGTTVLDKPLPTPDLVAVLVGDATKSINMSGTNGKIALVNGSASVAITGPTDPAVVDFVGFGSANQYEGTAATGALSNTTSAKRSSITDTNNNSADFTVGTPNLSYLN